MSDETKQPEERSDREVSELLDQIVEARGEISHLPNRWNEFQENNPHPPKPHVFKDASDLAEYHNAQVRYQWAERQQKLDMDETIRRYREAERKLTEMLPQGAAVIHTYQGRKEQYAGRHQIRHESVVRTALRSPFLTSDIITNLSIQRSS